MPGSLWVSSTATATMGPNSPTVPMAVMYAPNRVSSTPASRRTGSRVPSAVVVSTRPITRVLRAKPVDTRAAAIPKPMASERAHPRPARRSGSPLMRLRSIS